MLNGWYKKVRMTSAMMSACTITRTVSAMPPSLRFVPRVTLICLSLVPFPAPRVLLTAGRAACNESRRTSCKSVYVAIRPCFQWLDRKMRNAAASAGRARLGADDDECLGHRPLIRDGDVDSRLVSLRRDGPQARLRAARERHGGPARTQVDHAHVAEEHARPEPGAQGLGASLLGCETLGVGLHALGPSLGGGALDLGEDAREEALPMALDDALDAAD